MMSAGALRDIRQRRDAARAYAHWMPAVTVDRYDADVSALLDEVARLGRLVTEERGDGMSVGDGIARLHGTAS